MGDQHLDELSLIVKVVTQKMTPFVIMFGLSVILHGAASPGGGFQGGVVTGAAFILWAVGVNSRESRKRTPAFALKIAESAGILMYVGIGMAGIFMGFSFLTNQAMGFPPMGAPGSLFSGGALLGINIGIGMHVAGTIITLFYAFVEHEPDENIAMTRNEK